MRIFLFALMALVCSVSGMAAAGEEIATNSEKSKIRVGVYDSRAIAVAYTHSKAGQEQFQKQFQQLKKEHDEAEKAGDKAKAEQIKAEGQAGQERLHQQGFGTASVKKYLEKVKDRIPAVAKNAKVDLVVSKWEVVYQNPAAEVVDITDDLVKVFEPDARVLKIVEEMKKQPPLDEDEIRKIKD
jgi:Skp family chaperone for outer membrane proteins